MAQETEFYRVVASSDGTVLTNTPQEPAIRLYSYLHDTIWTLQVRAPRRIKGGTGKGLIVASANVDRTQLRELRDAINGFLGEG